MTLLHDILVCTTTTAMCDKVKVQSATKCTHFVHTVLQYLLLGPRPDDFDPVPMILSR